MVQTTAKPTAPAEPARSAGHRFSAWLHRHAGVRLTALHVAPLTWLVVAYLGALGVLLVSAFWTVNGFTGDVVHQPTVDNFRTIVSEAVYRNVTIRSIGVAAAVTVVTAVIALPIPAWDRITSTAGAAR